MLNKKDLVKQFELATLQEIKNYNDSLYTINQSLNGLRDSVKNLSKKVDENHALITSQKTLLESDLNSLKKDMENFSSRVSSELNDVRKVQRNQADTMLSMSGMIAICLNKHSDVDKKFYRYEEDVRNTNKMSQEFKKNADSNLIDFQRKVSKHIDKTKQEIISIPSEALALKGELEDKLQSYKLDVFGVLQEMEKNKHSTFVIQKQIENIYTLIERLKNEGTK